MLPPSCRTIINMAGTAEKREKYRFTLQWGPETAEKLQAGELIKSLGSRKSEFIVAAISEYVKSHPEMLSSGPKAGITVEPGLTRNLVETIVRDMIEARLTNTNPVFHNTVNARNQDSSNKADIDAMLKNIDLFTP